MQIIAYFRMVNILHPFLFYLFGAGVVCCITTV